MTNLENELKRFEKTTRFKELVAEKIKTNPKFAAKATGTAGGTKEAAAEYGNAMRELLRLKIPDIYSSITGANLLDHIIVEEKLVKGVGWIVNVSFDDKFMHRNSLCPEKYSKGVELNEIFNEGFPTIKNEVWGEWRGDYTYGVTHRDALHFVQDAVEKFNIKYANKAVAEYSVKYAGGTL